MEGVISVRTSEGTIRVAVVGPGEHLPSLAKLDPDEARGLAVNLVDAAREAEAQ
jgi:hypothetical protein